MRGSLESKEIGHGRRGACPNAAHRLYQDPGRGGIRSATKGMKTGSVGGISQMRRKPNTNGLA